MPDSSPLCTYTLGFDHDGDGVADGGPWGDGDTGGEESQSGLPETGSSAVALLGLSAVAVLGGGLLRRRIERV